MRRTILPTLLKKQFVRYYAYIGSTRRSWLSQNTMYTEFLFSNFAFVDLTFSMAYFRNFLILINRVFYNFGKVLLISKYWKEIHGLNICIKGHWIAGSIANFRGCRLSKKRLYRGIPFFPNVVLSARPGGFLSDPILVECRRFPLLYCSIQQLSERLIGESFFLAGGKLSNFSQIFYVNIFRSFFLSFLAKEKVKFVDIF